MAEHFTIKGVVQLSVTELIDPNVVDRIDPKVAERIKHGDSRLRSGLMEMRVHRRIRRGTIASKMGMSESGLENIELKRRGLKPATLVHWCRALGVPDYLLDVVAAQFLPGLVKLETGTWPPKISPALKFFMDSIPFSVTLLATPRQDVLYMNAEARRLSPWLVPAPYSAPRPVNLIAEALNNPAARESWVNWKELVHKAVFMLRARGEGIVEPDRFAEIKESIRTSPDFDFMWNTFLDEDAMSRNVTVLRDPDTGEEAEFTTFGFKILYTDQDAGEVVVLVPSKAHTTLVSA